MKDAAAHGGARPVPRWRRPPRRMWRWGGTGAEDPNSQVIG